MNVKNLLKLVLGLALVGAAHAQVIGAGPYGVGTPVPNQYNSQYTPAQGQALNNALGLPYNLDPGFYNSGGYVVPQGYASDRAYRRALRRQRRALRNQSVLPNYYLGY